jgi:radical S-adenosyl methionine domain-containing protein 2
VNFPRKDLSLQEAKHIIDEIKHYFSINDIRNGRINIAGGEPMLYPYIEDVIRYIHEQGIKCSIITNGSRLTEDFCKRMAGMLDTIGISIDAATREGNIRVGRCNVGGVPDFDRLERISDMMRSYGIKLKINTVVSKLNLNEDMASVYRRLKPNKIKLFYMHVIDNINGDVKTLVPTREEYEDFVMRNMLEDCDIVIEGPESMENAYFMINPEGEVYMNDNGVEEKYGSCFEKRLSDIFETVPLCKEKYFARYSENVKAIKM